MEAWIGMMSGTDEQGLIIVPLDGWRLNGSTIGAISNEVEQCVTN